jgi:hypothetical protein
MMQLLDIVTLGTGKQTILEYSKSLCNEICTVTLYAAIHLSRLLQTRIHYIQTIVSVNGITFKNIFYSNGLALYWAAIKLILQL